MKVKMLEQFQFTDELKERLVLLVVYQNQSPKDLPKKYGLPNVHVLTNWVRISCRCWSPDQQPTLNLPQ